LNFRVLENQSESWKSAGKLVSKKGTNLSVSVPSNPNLCHPTSPRPTNEKVKIAAVFLFLLLFLCLFQTTFKGRVFMTHATKAIYRYNKSTAGVVS